MNKINDVVSWVMPEEQILKLEKAGKTYDISDEVVKFLDSKGLFDKLVDKTVDVDVDESKASDDEEGSSGLITRLVLSDGKTEPKEEPQKEETPVNSENKLVVKEIIVGGVSVAKTSAVDKETKIWYNLDSTINAQKFKNECTGKKVEISVAQQEKGNDVIKGYILKEEDKKEEPKKTEKRTVNNMGNSIEAQAAMKAANVITSQMVDKDSKPEFVEKLITRIAKHNFKIIQNLKI